jgi:hypothetical protein
MVIIRFEIYFASWWIGQTEALRHMVNMKVDLDLWLVSGMVLLSSIAIFYLTYLSIFNVGDIRGVESNVTYIVQLILGDNSLLYQSPEHLPFTVTQYSPLYYVFCDAIFSLFSIDSNDPHLVRILARSISIAFLFGICALMANLFLKKFKLSIIESAILTLGFVVIVFPWYQLARPDVLVAFFFILAIERVFHFRQVGNVWSIIFAGSAIALAIASKLNALMFVGLFGLVFLIQREWMAIISFLLGLCATLAMLILFLELAGYDFRFVYENLIDGVNNQSSFKMALYKPYKTFLSNFFVFVGLSVLLIGFAWKALVKGDVSKSSVLLGVLSLGVFAASSLAALKKGAAVHYYNEFFLVVIILIGLAMSVITVKERKVAIIIFALFVTQISIIQVYRYGNFIKDRTSYGFPSRLVSENRNKVINYLTGKLGDKYFYTGERELSQSLPMNSILFASDIIVASFKRGVYSDENVRQSVIDGSLKYLVFGKNYRGWQFVNFAQYFRQVDKIGDYRIYLSKQYYEDGSSAVAPEGK